MANRLLRRVRDYAQVRADGIIDESVAGDGLKMLDVDEYGLDEMDARVKQLVAERERISEAMGALDLEVFPSGANFVLFRAAGLAGREVWQGLVDESVLVRDCSGWPRLTDCLR